MKTVDVAEPTVPRFRDHRQRPPIPRGIRLSVSNAPLNHRVAHNSDTVRVGDHHRTFQKTGFLHPRRSGHFSISVFGKPTGKNRIAHGLLSSRQNRSYTGAHWTFPDLQFSFTGNKCGVTDSHAGDIGDGV